MKRLTSLLFATVFVFCFVSLTVQSQAFAYSSSTVEVLSFEASTFSILCGNSETITFSAQISADKKLSSTAVEVYSSDGEFITHLHDNGKDGDKQAGDGVYSSSIILHSDSAKTVSYYAQVRNIKSQTHPIKFRNKINDVDFDTASVMWTQLETFKNELAIRGMNAKEIASATHDYLMRNYSQDIQSIWYESDKSFSFVLKSGIENYFEYIPTDENTQSTERVKEKLKELSYIAKSSIGVWSPFYGLDASFTDSYITRAHAMDDVANFDTVDSYYGADASVESFKNFDEYGVIMIDSHGAEYNGGGYICIPRPGSYDNQDIADGHLVLSGSTILMRGTFMQKYCDILPNTIIYIGICSGMAADNFYAPLLNHGAAFVAGFDDSVSFTFDNIIMNDFCQRLVETNPATDSQYTAGEALAACVELYGDVDNYASARAHLVSFGTPDVVASARAISVDSVTLEPTLTLYHSNEYVLKPVISPSNANRYTVTWSSNAPLIVSVDENGHLTAGTTDGSAVITCLVTDISGDTQVKYEVKTTVTVSGHMPTIGISLPRTTMTLYADAGVTEPIIAQVLPENASNRTILYSSSNPNVAAVDSLGIVTAHSIGVAYVTVVTEDGGYGKTVVVNVRAGDINRALNKANGILSFGVDSNNPSHVSTHDDRYCVKTGNSKLMNSSCSIVLDAGQLEAGSVLCFDWAVSSEANYDTFKFMVNNAYETEISGSRQWTTETYTVEESGVYTFRWTYSKDYSTDIEADCGWLDEVDILKPTESHKVTFTDMDGTTVLSVQDVPHGESAQVPAHPEQAGCAFLGWSEDFTNIRSDMTICAIYEIGEDVCKVVFLGMDNAVIATKTVVRGTSVEPPEAPLVSGYVFLGWDSDLTNIINDTEVHAIYGMLGDINRDGKLNTGDATYLLRCSAGIVIPDDSQKLLGDFNSDGRLNTGDAASVLKWLVEQN